MAENTKIEWATHTFNPWVGCTKISPACDHCYAEGWAKRTGNTDLWQGERRRTSVANWRKPLKWQADAAKLAEPQFVFCASLADIFDNQVPVEWRGDLWALIKATPDLIWLLLTKRPQNIKKMLPADWGRGYPNVWLGTTCENQTTADRNIPHLLVIPAVRRFVSAEPLLGPIDFKNWMDDLCPNCLNSECHPTIRADSADVFSKCGRFVVETPEPLLHWIIVGGESGPHARPMHPDWARTIRDQCAAAGTEFLFKQWGEWAARDVLAQDIPKFLKLRDGSGPVHIFDDNESIARVGKSYAGRLLDGIEHNGRPTP